MYNTKNFYNILSFVFIPILMLHSSTVLADSNTLKAYEEDHLFYAQGGLPMILASKYTIEDEKYRFYMVLPFPRVSGGYSYKFNTATRLRGELELQPDSYASVRMLVNGYYDMDMKNFYIYFGLGAGVITEDLTLGNFPFINTIQAILGIELRLTSHLSISDSVHFTKNYSNNLIIDHYYEPLNYPEQFSMRNFISLKYTF